MKIINGEERGMYCCELDENADREAQSRILAEFEETVGYLPLVSYGLAGCRLEVLEEAYGVLLGKSFSNHVIDTKKMVSIHIPERSFRTLDDCANWLGITCEAETDLERECRLIWNLYCRLDRSELEHKSK